MEKSQREYYLNEQIKAAQKELGDISEEGDEISQLEKDIAKAGMSKEALKKQTMNLPNLSKCHLCLQRPQLFVLTWIG